MKGNLPAMPSPRSKAAGGPRPLTHMSYSSLPAVAVRSAFRSMVYISYCNTDQTVRPPPPPGPRGRVPGVSAIMS